MELESLNLKDIPNFKNELVVILIYILLMFVSFNKFKYLAPDHI